MKKIRPILIGLLILALAAPNLLAQTKANVIKTNLFSPIIRTYWLHYERCLNDDMSATLGGFFTSFQPEGASLTGWGIQPEFRYYLSSAPAPHGIYVAPRLRYISLNAKDDAETAEVDYTIYGGGLTVGAQALLKEVVTIEAFLGPGYAARRVNVVQGDEAEIGFDQADGFTIFFGINLGIAF